MPLALSRKSIVLGWWLGLALWFGLAPLAEGIIKAKVTHAQGVEISFCQVENGNWAKKALYGDESGFARTSSDSVVFVRENSGPVVWRLKPYLISIDLALAVRPPLSDVSPSAESAFSKERQALLRNLLLGLPPPGVA